MEYLLVAAILAGMTVTPVPLPPSWLVLAYLSVELGAHPAGVVVAGAAGAAAGRTLLAAWTRALGPRLMRRATRENVDYLAARLHGRRPRPGSRRCSPSPRHRPAPSTRPRAFCG